MDILSHPNPALSSGTCDVDPVADETLRPLAERMARMMYEAPGIGLAAPQIGVMKRVIVYDLSEDGQGLTALCNPHIVARSEECETDDEGCLSLPGISVPVERACQITCEGVSLSGEKVRIQAEGLEARMFQHEVDHLDGLLIIDRATPEERKAALKRYREALEAGAKPGETSI
ncbi:MAG TPA: peptide deformylase [Coriobacteriia bacterium]|nr:peptide deformylase [Coriobacteriia bacterium]